MPEQRKYTADVRTGGYTGGTTETVPFGAGDASGDLATTSRSKDYVMTFPQSIHVPVHRSNRTDCGDVQPRGWYRCNRPAGHTGRHHFAHRRSTGRVRGVWG